MAAASEAKAKEKYEAEGIIIGSGDSDDGMSDTEGIIIGSGGSDPRVGLDALEILCNAEAKTNLETADSAEGRVAGPH